MKSLKEFIVERNNDIVFAKLIECYDKKDDIVFVAVVSETGSDSEARKTLKRVFPKLEISSISNLDGKIEKGNCTPGQLELLEQCAVILDDAINSVDEL